MFSHNAVLQQGETVPVWGSAGEGEKVVVEFQEQRVETTAKDGKWMVRLNPLKPGGPFAMTIRGVNTVTLTNLLVGEVWLCSGQSNMAWPLSRTENAEKAIAASGDPMLRLWSSSNTPSDQPQRDGQGQWRECSPESVASFSAVAYYFGRDLRKALNVPVGLVHAAVNGTSAEAWISRSVLDSEPRAKSAIDRFEKRVQEYATALTQYPALLAKHKEAVEKAKQEGKEIPPELRAPVDPRKHRDRLSGCYNGLIAPLLPCVFKGVLWYQGEANIPYAYEYRALLPLLIRSWREAWGNPTLSFLIVQLPGCGAISSAPTESGWAELREAQLLTARTVPNTGMVVTMDCGESDNIHPARKEPVGVRLALAARGLAYGEKIVYSGPVYKDMKVEGDKAVLSFEHVGSGLVVPGGALKSFTVAGEDRKFVAAEAEIRENTVVVWNATIPKPVSVRYGWANFPEINLGNKEGLRASPFRTDDYPISSTPKEALSK